MFSALRFLRERCGECRHYQTAKLVLQQLGGSAQRGLTGQRLERLDAMSRGVPGTNRIAAHADIWAEKAATYKYTGIGTQRQ